MKEKMDIKQLIQKIGVTRFIVIVLAGIALLVLSLPSGSLTGSATADNDQKSVSSKDTQKLAWDATEQYIKIQEKETENILSKVQGIGKVDVMITLASSEEKVTMQDNDVSNDDTTQTQRRGVTEPVAIYIQVRECSDRAGWNEKSVCCADQFAEDRGDLCSSKRCTKQHDENGNN